MNSFRRDSVCVCVCVCITRNRNSIFQYNIINRPRDNFENRIRTIIIIVSLFFSFVSAIRYVSLQLRNKVNEKTNNKSFVRNSNAADSLPKGIYVVCLDNISSSYDTETPFNRWIGYKARDVYRRV